MPPVKEKAVRIPITFSEGVATLLRAMVKRDRLSQSEFVQAAVIRAIRNHRSPEEFINEGKEKKGREKAPGGLNPKLDKPDGRPIGHDPALTDTNWRWMWDNLYVRKDIDKMRGELGREAITDEEWKSVVKYMGYEPGRKKSMGEQWPEREAGE